MYDAFKSVRFGINLDVNDMIFRKISLIPTFAEPAINFPVSNRLLRDGLIDAKLLVTHTFCFADARGAMTGIVDGSSPVIKAVMLPNG
jgi:threonine dehydrogenase-like Zn-dependent dehydrogenase